MCRLVPGSLYGDIPKSLAAEEIKGMPNILILIVVVLGSREMQGSLGTMGGWGVARL